jgi:superfamily I DNA and/or RNA helicase
MVRARKWILVGDPKQLPPYVEEGVEHDFSEFAEEEIRETIFSRLLKRLPEHSTAILRNQYRMVAGIGDLISECFYKDEGGLNSPVTTARVRLTGIFSKAVTWLDTSPRDDRRHTPIGLSLENVCEGKIVRRTLERIDYIARRRKATYDVAVIAGYTAQVALIETMIRDRYEQWQNITVECNTVDAFQGRQAEICIYSATRSHANLRLGFLREQPRLNVALSRARSALIVIGDAAFFRAAKGQNPFAPVLTYIENNPSSCEVRTADVS